MGGTDLLVGALARLGRVGRWAATRVGKLRRRCSDGGHNATDKVASTVAPGLAADRVHVRAVNAVPVWCTCGSW